MLEKLAQIFTKCANSADHGRATKRFEGVPVCKQCYDAAEAEAKRPKVTYRMGGTWGSAINKNRVIAETPQLTTVMEIVGWKNPCPKNNDFLETKMKSGRIALYKISNVESNMEKGHDPRDMFFATATFVRYVADENGNYEPDYKPLYEEDANKGRFFF